LAGYWAQSRTQILDQNDNLIIGALAYFYEATTSTPMSVYSSADLGTPNVHTHPVVADGNARWPQVFFDDTDPDPDDPLVSGRRFYDVKVTDAAGVLIYYDRSVPIIGTVTGEGGGGGGGVPVDQNALAKTGDVKMKFCRAADPADAGWVRMNGGTISKGGSGGTEFADASTQDLFVHLYAHGELICPVAGRTGNALTDFNAGLKLTLPDMRGRAPFGVDAMGNGAPSTGVGSNLIAPAYVDTPIPAPGIARDTVGAVGGEDDIALATAQMPAHSHTATGVPVDGAIPAKPALKAPNHGHPWQASLNAGSSSEGDGGGLMIAQDSAGPASIQDAYTGAPSNILGREIGGSGDINITGNTGLTGGTNAIPAGNASAHENMPPFMLIQFQIKL
jgi:microcystin-dependent protein